MLKKSFELENACDVYFKEMQGVIPCLFLQYMWIAEQFIHQRSSINDVKQVFVYFYILPTCTEVVLKQTP